MSTSQSLLTRIVFFCYVLLLLKMKSIEISVDTDQGLREREAEKDQQTTRGQKHRQTEDKNS